MARPAVPGRESAILDAALNLFAKKGYASATMADIALEAKVATGTLYLYFKSKDEVLRQCAVRFYEEHQIEAQVVLTAPIIASEKLELYLVNRFNRWNAETKGAQPGTDLASAMLNIAPSTTKKEQALWSETLSAILMQGVSENLFHFDSLEQEIQIFYFNLIAYFPLPGNKTLASPTKKDLIAMIQWFCKKWRL